ncbi:FAR-17a/AIG1-like protein [Lasiosphaeris hirsuta]|uniref:FAR-17a/AIG1-like protein n=1 Tax=Lasiosphaeris hirsuta TaxID=260670 RepID=A0AA40EAW6_9PEZI|nr:FAR-17a/AIG1-like protein [Lasiosphaeris hirsuta]
MTRHPLQRLPSPSRSLSAAIHVLGLLSFSASFGYLQKYPNPLHQGVGGDFQFLTIIGLALSTATFISGILADITLNHSLFEIKNILSVCSAPLEVLISVLYWGICAIDRKLVVPPDVSLPLLPDIGFHAMPAIMLALDLVLLSPPWTIRGYGAMAISLTVAFLYWGWVEYCFSYNGWYPYPLLAILTTWQRVLLFSFSAFLMTGSTMVLKFVYGSINGIGELKEEALRPLKIE